jgi:hypothetical protein
MHITPGFLLLQIWTAYFHNLLLLKRELISPRQISAIPLVEAILPNYNYSEFAPLAPQRLRCLL